MITKEATVAVPAPAPAAPEPPRTARKRRAWDEAPRWQIYLPLGTFDECRAQFAHEFGIVPGSSGEVCVKGGAFVGHVKALRAEALRRGLRMDRNRDMTAS